MADRRPLFPAQARVLADSPDKLINEVNETHMRLAADLHEVILGAETETIFISPYYVPGPGGVQLLRDLVAKGVRVIILTNSLASNDVIAAHAGYAKRRKAMIEAGVELYEMMPRLAVDEAGERSLAFSGSSGASLHAKMAERYRAAVGSLFNNVSIENALKWRSFDPDGRHVVHYTRQDGIDTYLTRILAAGPLVLEPPGIDFRVEDVFASLPPEEDDELCLPAAKAGLNFIRLATPTPE